MYCFAQLRHSDVKFETHAPPTLVVFLFILSSSIEFVIISESLNFSNK